MALQNEMLIDILKELCKGKTRETNSSVCKFILSGKQPFNTAALHFKKVLSVSIHRKFMKCDWVDCSFVLSYENVILKLILQMIFNKENLVVHIEKIPVGKNFDIMLKELFPDNCHVPRKCFVFKYRPHGRIIEALKASETRHSVKTLHVLDKEKIKYFYAMNLSAFTFRIDWENVEKVVIKQFQTVGMAMITIENFERKYGDNLSIIDKLSNLVASFPESFYFNISIHEKRPGSHGWGRILDEFNQLTCEYPKNLYLSFYFHSNGKNISEISSEILNSHPLYKNTKKGEHLLIEHQQIDVAFSILQT